MSNQDTETPAEDAAENETSASRSASASTIHVSDVRQSLYAPDNSISTFELKHPGIESVNQRADQLQGKRVGA